MEWVVSPTCDEAETGELYNFYKFGIGQGDGFKEASNLGGKEMPELESEANLQSKNVRTNMWKKMG